MTGRPLAEASWPEIYAAPRDVLIVPVGALEQHGPHLPLDTDSYLATAVAGRVHQLRSASGLAPVLPFGSSGEHRDFPGTLSIGTDALTSVVVELVRDACRYWYSVLVVNGHGRDLDDAVAGSSPGSARPGRAWGDFAGAHPAGTTAHRRRPGCELERGVRRPHHRQR
jgi:creatinine amidohydrolase/Fe(II)-dependent formamide hydrolase-like protein